MFVFCMCIMRQIFILVMKYQGAGVSGVLFSYPFSWMLTLAVTGGYILYLNYQNEKKEGQLCESSVE